MNVKKWIMGLFSAIIGGAANCVTVMILDPVAFNVKDGLNNVLIASGVSALVAGAAYIKQHPIDGSK